MMRKRRGTAQITTTSAGSLRSQLSTQKPGQARQLWCEALVYIVSLFKDNFGLELPIYWKCPTTPIWKITSKVDLFVDRANHAPQYIRYHYIRECTITLPEESQPRVRMQHHPTNHRPPMLERNIGKKNRSRDTHSPVGD
jgi:hypothetical protein